MDELLEAHCRQITELGTQEFSNMVTSKMFDLGDFPQKLQQCAHSITEKSPLSSNLGGKEPFWNTSEHSVLNKVALSGSL